jgi:IPT/TIG domain
MGKRRVGRRTLWSVSMIVVLVCCVLALPAVARATSGGSTIATAPQLPIGTTFVGGAVAKHEFWRVTLAAGDTLTIDYQPANGGEVDLDVFKPSVTDFTLGSASSVVSAWTTGKSVFTWTATGQGSWILEVYSYDGYQLSAHVQHVMMTKLLPASGRRGVIVTISGRNFGAKRGTSFVKFGATKCSKYVFWSKTKIKCRVPAKAKFGKLKVTVVTSAGTSNAKAFTVKR